MNNDSAQTLRLNPDYGKGIFRRSILLRADKDKITAGLEDNYHALSLFLSHDGKVVTGISAETIRAPFNTCIGAIDVLQGLVGVELSVSPKAISSHSDPRINCTHLYDLAVLAIAMAERGETQRRYDMEIPDEVDEKTISSVKLNGEVVLRWSFKNMIIETPQFLKGQNFFEGLRRRLEETLEGDELEAALVLQQAHFVSLGRPFDFESLSGMRIVDEPLPKGTCYAFGPGVIEEGYRLPGTIKDFTHTPEQMLKTTGRG
jgi:hypothetical protein